METISTDELTYLRNLLTLNVGDTVEWCTDSTSNCSHQSTKKRGVITTIYPSGRCSYLSLKDAFMMVHSSPQRYSVSLLNPTLKKLETDK